MNKWHQAAFIVLFVILTDILTIFFIVKRYHLPIKAVDVAYIVDGKRIDLLKDFMDKKITDKQLQEEMARHINKFQELIKKEDGTILVRQGIMKGYDEDITDRIYGELKKQK